MHIIILQTSYIGTFHIRLLEDEMCLMVLLNYLLSVACYNEGKQTMFTVWYFNSPKVRKCILLQQLCPSLCDPCFTQH